MEGLGPPTRGLLNKTYMIRHSGTKINIGRGRELSGINFESQILRI
jgi:hypothetical protein